MTEILSEGHCFGKRPWPHKSSIWQTFFKMAAIANAVFKVGTYTINHGLESHILYSHLQLQSSVQLKPALICSHTWLVIHNFVQLVDLLSEDLPLFTKLFPSPVSRTLYFWLTVGCFRANIKSSVINVAGPSIFCEMLSAVCQHHCVVLP